MRVTKLISGISEPHSRLHADFFRFPPVAAQHLEFQFLQVGQFQKPHSDPIVQSFDSVNIKPVRFQGRCIKPLLFFAPWVVRASVAGRYTHLQLAAFQFIAEPLEHLGSLPLFFFRIIGMRDLRKESRPALLPLAFSLAARKVDLERLPPAVQD
jgi:hypothetical protein